MKILWLKDKTIPANELKDLERQLTEWYQKRAGITPTFFTEEKDYTAYPTFIDEDGDKRPTHAWLREIGKDVSRRYLGEGTDHVIILVHEDNWRSPGIWGTNYSNVFSGYQVQYCRWDKDNIANSFGTVYHEMMHSFDALIYAETGEDINDLLDLQSWDREVVHGNGVRKDYIRYKEQGDKLAYIAPLLRQAYTKRQQRYETNPYFSIIKLLQMTLVLLRRLISMKNGYPHPQDSEGQNAV